MKPKTTKLRSQRDSSSSSNESTPHGSFLIGVIKHTRGLGAGDAMLVGEAHAEGDMEVSTVSRLKNGLGP